MRTGHVVYLIGILVSAAAFFMGAWDTWRSISSGTPVAKHIVREYPGTFRSFEIDLDPGMNPMRFLVSAKIHTGYSTNNWYRCTLSLGGKAAVSRNISFSKPNAYDEVSVNTLEFTVETAGRYRLAVVAGNPSLQRDGIVRMEVQTLRNSSPFQWQRLLWYFGVFAGAWIFAAAFGDKPAWLQKMDDEAQGRE